MSSESLSDPIVTEEPEIVEKKVVQKRKKPSESKKSDTEPTAEEYRAICSGFFASHCPCVAFMKEMELRRVPPSSPKVKAKKAATPEALSILQLWRDVCFEVSGAKKVLPKNSDLHKRALEIFHSRYSKKSNSSTSSSDAISESDDQKIDASDDRESLQ